VAVAIAVAVAGAVAVAVAVALGVAVGVGNVVFGAEAEALGAAEAALADGLGLGDAPVGDGVWDGCGAAVDDPGAGVNVPPEQPTVHNETASSATYTRRDIELTPLRRLKRRKRR
jgi:hypothetical protein